MRAARWLSGSTARTSSAVTRAGSRSPAASDVSAAVSRRSSRRSSLVSAEVVRAATVRQTPVARETYRWTGASGRPSGRSVGPRTARAAPTCSSSAPGRRALRRPGPAVTVMSVAGSREGDRARGDGDQFGADQPVGLGEADDRDDGAARLRRRRPRAAVRTACRPTSRDTPGGVSPASSPSWATSWTLSSTRSTPGPSPWPAATRGGGRRRAGQGSSTSWPWPGS